MGDYDEFSVEDDLKRRVGELLELGETVDRVEKIIVSELEDVGVHGIDFINELEGLLGNKSR